MINSQFIIIVLLIAFSLQAHAFEFDVDQFKSKYLPVPEEIQVRCQKYGIKRYIYNALVREYFLQSGDLLQPIIESTTLKSLTVSRMNQMPEQQRLDVLNASEIFAHHTTLDFLQKMSEFIFHKFNIQSKVTALTHNSNYLTDDHCGHSSGFAMDIRPLPAYVPTTWFDKLPGHYNREMNMALIINLIQNPQVSLIFFDDPVILESSEIQALIAKKKKTMPTFTYSTYQHTYMLNGVSTTVSHDNHIHIEILPPDDVTQEIRKIVIDNQLFDNL